MHPIDVRELTHGLKRFFPAVIEDFMVEGVRVQQQFDDYGNHRLYVAGEFSHWTSSQYLTRVGDYAGTSEYWAEVLPRVFKIVSHG